MALQWRAEQLPGQTGALRRYRCSTMLEASMEGRAIARPNRDQHQASQHASTELASMEGRAIARPNSIASRKIPSVYEPGIASMEGRAIARPNPPSPSASPGSVGHCRFNGGPSNCPAKPGPARDDKDAPTQCPGFNGGPSNCPAKPAHPTPRTDRPYDPSASMEGRAIARPNVQQQSVQTASRLDPVLQWRAEQLPGQTLSEGSRCDDASYDELQWRAEQLPGQTGSRPDRCSSRRL